MGLIRDLVKLAGCDPGRGTDDTWRGHHIFSYLGFTFRQLSLRFKALAFSVVLSVCNVDHWLLFCYLDVDSEAENNLSSFIMSHYARNYAKHGEMY